MARAMRELAVPVKRRRGTGWWTPRAPGAAGRPSTCRPPRRSWPRAPAAASPSTATARPPASPARPTCSRRSARASTSTPRRWRPASTSSGFGFMFAPSHHPAMKHVVPVRKALAVRTIFNFLGPLTNPAGATRQLIGVSDRRFLDIVAACLGELGCEHALVVSSDDGLDELSVSGPTHVVELRDGGIDAHSVTPGVGGAEPAPRATRWPPGTPEKNAGIARRVLDGVAGARARPDRAQRRRGDLRGRGADTIEEGVRRAEDGDRLRRGARGAGSLRGQDAGAGRRERPPRGPRGGHARGARAARGARPRSPSRGARL